MTLAAIVVFTTTYMLILPAFTLDSQSAAEQGGIDVPAVETTAENTSDSTDSSAADENAAASDANADADQAEASGETKADQSAEKADTKAKDPDESAAKVKDADPEKSDVKLLTGKKTITARQGKGDDFAVSAVVSTDAKVPADVTITATELGKNTDGFDYDQYKDDALAALKKDSSNVKSIKSIKFYDISLESDSQDKSVEPSAPVSVKISYEDGMKVSDADNIRIVHFAEQKNGSEKAQVLDANKNNVETTTAANGSKVTEASFDTDGFSKYAVVEVETIEKTVITADGKTYKVSVSYDKNAKIPEGSELEVKELTGDDYDAYLEKAASKLDKNAEDLGMAKFFDITIRNGDDEVKIASPVDVEIKLLDSDSLADSTQVLHFSNEDKADVVDSKVDGDTVKFEAEGFSVYAVVGGSTDDNARMTVEFYSGGTPVETMYVKNSDTLEELELILHDPGAGTLGDGEVFNGWILDNPNYTTEDVEGALTIGQVREWAEAENITEGETHRLDAAICKLYTITYKDLDGTVLGKDAIPVKSSEYGTAQVGYVVNQGYTPHDDVHNFEGWTVDDDTKDNVTSTPPADGIYPNDTQITIKGDVSFTVNAPEGNWLIFDENGKGGKYNAPQFVKADDVTKEPCAAADMTRKGYSFDGWYDTKEHADAHGIDPRVTTGAFGFGEELTAKTTIYASWIPNKEAPYTVILWGQKLNDAGTDVVNEYEVLGSYSTDGIVGQIIPYTSKENGDEDYVTGVGDNNGHYTGYCLTDDSKGQQITITPEGDAVLNLYYDRIKYAFKFYLYRDSGSGTNRYTYANNSGTGSSLNNLVTWHNASRNHPSAPDYADQTETHRFDNTNYTYHYFTIEAYYGQNISAIWPTYDKINGADGRDPVSYVMMVGTELKPNPTSSGSGTVKGVITVMDDNILGATNNANGNYVVVRFPGNYNNWRYHIWLETVEGEDYSGKTTYTYEGKTYYEETVQVVRSSNTEPKSQNEPTYPGFDYMLRVGQNRQGGWEPSSSIRNTDEKGHKYGSYWTTTEGGTTLYHLNYIYNRQVFKISYFDGQYYDGAGNKIQNRATHLLKESDEIAQGARIPDADRNYVPGPQEDGYVFAGWYVDEACTVPYTWSTMPIGGIKVYAKWVQKQYRVFLHPNAGHDESLDWGSETVNTSFRVNYGGKISTPTGTRESSGYEFVGWYTDPSCESRYLYKPDTVLNDDTVTTPYDQTKATELDKWGDPLVDEQGRYIDDEGNILVDDEGNPNPNKDSINKRYWVTGQLNLYAKWRKILEGSDGINVVYTADDGKGHVGSNPPHDDALYPDQADATAQAACNAPENWYFKHWVVQKWNSEQNKFVDTDITVWPGQKFTVKEGDAHKEAVEGETDKFTYTIQLRAEYAEPESHLPTHIWWFNNYADDGAQRHYAAHQNEGIKINEAVNILAAPTREGYEFVGWARVPTSTSESLPGENPNPPTAKVLELSENDVYLKYEDGKFKLNDPTSDYDGREVTQVAADERLEYHDLYAVWKAKTYDVDIKKIVNGVTETKKFTINYSYGSESGSVDLGNGQSTSDASIGKTINVPYGTLITVTEEPDDEYKASYSATHKVTVKDDNGNESVKDQSFTAEESGEFRITSDTLITVTNTRKSQKVRIFKIDQASADQTIKVPLGGAEFTLNNANYTTNSEGFTDVVELNVSNESYTLVETKAPDGYNLPENPSYITVKGDKVEYKQGSVGQTVDASYDPDTRVYTVTITNTAGKPLPHTGGIGTTIFYILGSLLVVGCGIVLISRRRMGSGK